MKIRSGLGLLAAAAITAIAGAQHTLDWPVEQREAYHVDTGELSNNTGRAETAFAQIVHIRDTAWVRLYFEDVNLDGDSFVRVTSLLDLEQQILDRKAMRMWGNTTAYFNGDMVLVELVTSAKSAGNSFSLAEVGRNDITGHGRGVPGNCGICGGSDDRVPSNETWSCRLFPAGCTASVWNEDSCLVSAGHCIGGSMVIQFNVPNSNGNCSTNNPPVADQFPVIQEQSVNGGVGNDWAVMIPGTNNLGQLPYDRYGEMRPIASTGPGVGQTNQMFGYGVDPDNCTRNQTQQFHQGPISQVFGTWYTYSIDLRGGNSGSALIRNDEILGIATHCPCPNVATRIDHPSFVAARDALCPPSVGEEAPLFRLKVKKGTVTSGGLSDVDTSNNVYIEYASDNTNNKKQVNTQIWTKTTIPQANVVRMDVKVEIRCDVADIKTRLQIRNFGQGGWTTLSNAVTPTSDTVLIFEDIANPADHMRSNGQIRIRINPSKKNIPGFNFFIDEVETIVYE